MDAGQRSSAHPAGAAPAGRTQKGGGESPYQLPLAESRCPHQKIGVHGPAGADAELRDRLDLVDDAGEQRPDGALVVARPGHRPPSGNGPSRAATAARIRAATSATSPVPSTTAQRSLSASANAT